MDKPSVVERWFGQNSAHPTQDDLILASVNLQVDLMMELKRALQSHRAIGSLHEGYGILMEEVDEYWEQVKLKRSERDLAAMRKELLQVAAMSLRIIIDVIDPTLEGGGNG